MTEPASKLYPGFAGAKDVAMTGTLEIDTGLKSLRSFQVSQMTDVAANEESFLTWAEVAGSPGKVLVSSWKGGSNHATVGDSEVLISWLALGDR